MAASHTSGVALLKSSSLCHYGRPCCRWEALLRMLQLDQLAVIDLLAPGCSKLRSQGSSSGGASWSSQREFVFMPSIGRVVLIQVTRQIRHVRVVVILRGARITGETHRRDRRRGKGPAQQVKTAITAEFRRCRVDGQQIYREGGGVGEI